MHSGLYPRVPASASPLVHSTCVASSERVCRSPGPSPFLTHPLLSTCRVTLPLTQKNLLTKGVGGTCLEVPRCCHFRESYTISCCPTPSLSPSGPITPGRYLACHGKGRTHTSLGLPSRTPPPFRRATPTLSELSACRHDVLGGSLSDHPGRQTAKGVATTPTHFSPSLFRPEPVVTLYIAEVSSL